MNLGNAGALAPAPQAPRWGKGGVNPSAREEGSDGRPERAKGCYGEAPL